jgi:5'-nucleotidase
MGAALEGCVFDIPSIGVSLCDYQPGDDFTESCRLGRILAEQVLIHGLPHGVYLNLNVPNVPAVKGISIGRQTDGKWVREFIVDEVEGKLNFWITGEYEMSGPDYPENDITLLKNGYASLVPCKVDVTDYAFMEELKKWEFEEERKNVRS